MRENPWHLRLPSTEHDQRFKNLRDLQALTARWLTDTQSNRPTPPSTRLSNDSVSENLWMLDALSDLSTGGLGMDLESILDDTHLEDFLGRLEHTIWAVQSWTIQELYERCFSAKGPIHRTELDRLLEQAAWDLGRTSAQTRWKNLTLTAQKPLHEVLLALNDSPFSAYPRHSGFLVRRAISTEIQIELRSCPHQIHFPEVKDCADQLCRLHSHWMKGFAHSLNDRITLEHIIQSPRCIQRWYFS